MASTASFKTSSSSGLDLTAIHVEELKHPAKNVNISELNFQSVETEGREYNMIESCVKHYCPSIDMQGREIRALQQKEKLLLLKAHKNQIKKRKKAIFAIIKTHQEAFISKIKNFYQFKEISKFKSKIKKEIKVICKDEENRAKQICKILKDAVKKSIADVKHYRLEMDASAWHSGATFEKVISKFDEYIFLKNLDILDKELGNMVQKFIDTIKNETDLSRPNILRHNKSYVDKIFDYLNVDLPRN